jgi:hypothetical protein
MNSASLFSLAGRYDNPILPRLLAPIDYLKIPAQYLQIKLNGHGQGTKENLKSLNIKIFSTVNGRIGLAVYLGKVNNLKKPTPWCSNC